MILTFQDEAAREAFLALMGQERPDIRPLCREAQMRPHVVVRLAQETGDQADWIHRHLHQFAGQAFGNVQFEISTPPS